jgi:hypothetical protein
MRKTWKNGPIAMKSRPSGLREQTGRIFREKQIPLRGMTDRKAAAKTRTDPSLGSG